MIIGGTSSLSPIYLSPIYLTSLLAYNLAKLSVARALGNAEDNLSKYLAVQ